MGVFDVGSLLGATASSVSVLALLTRAQTLLNDLTGVRWPVHELLGWLNDGQRELVVIRPQAFVRTAPVQLVAGTRQTLPAGATLLIAIPRNSTPPYRPIRRVDRATMDAVDPSWHYSATASYVKHYMYDRADPLHFYVYPPQGGTPALVDVTAAVLPPDCGDPTVADAGTPMLQVPAMYAPALLNYIGYRAFSKDSEADGNEAKATGYYQAFAALAGAATANETTLGV